MTFQDQEGRSLSQVDFVYDEAGRLIEEAQTRTEEAMLAEMPERPNPGQMAAMRDIFTFRLRHRYDAQGCRCETRCQIGPLGDERTMSYNEHGDVVKQVSEDESREYGMDDEGRLSEHPTKENIIRSETRFDYDYDARGNWTRKSVMGRGEARPDFTTSSIELRTIRYFDVNRPQSK